MKKNENISTTVNLKKYEKPSNKITKQPINDVFVDPSKRKGTKPSGFLYYYHNGMIPCKINHGSISNKLFWPSNICLESTFISYII